MSVSASVYCSRCECESNANSWGACLWCHQPLGEQPKPARSHTTPPRRPREEHQVEDDKAASVAAIQRYAREHDGNPPTRRDWAKLDRAEHPSVSTLTVLFGGFAAAIEAAGFEKPTRGTRARSLGTPAPRAPSPSRTPDPEPPPTAQRNGDSFASRAQRLIEVHALIDSTREQLLDLQAEALVLVDDLKEDLGVA